ncbi:MAG: helix-turn-helix transcriptional regulator [Elusimicrobiota bacterium]
MKRIAQTLGQNVRTQRLHLGLTQEALSEKAGIHCTFIGHIERGSKLPSLRVLSRIAGALGTTLSDLLRGASR